MNILTGAGRTLQRIVLSAAIWIRRAAAARQIREARQKAREEALTDAQWRIFLRDHGLTSTGEHQQ